jgi:hypothetical protein
VICRDGEDKNTLMLGLEYVDWLGRRHLEWKKEGSYKLLGTAIRTAQSGFYFSLFPEMKYYWLFEFDLDRFEDIPTPLYILNVALR